MPNQLDWSEYKDAGLGDAYADIPRHGGDFAKAVAMCIHARRCETDEKGVMCPSYRVTGNVDESTGGRIRLLKAALNQPDAGGLPITAELDHAMASCVACKGCKRECENAVDLAMIKIEYLAAKYAREGTPWRVKLLSELPEWLQWRGVRRLIAWRNRSFLLRHIGAAITGLSAQRALPEPVINRAINPLRNVAPASPVAEVVLFHDTFSRAFAPEQILAAEQVLTAGGYKVVPLQTCESGKPLCCGRTQLAHGQIDKAREKAGRLVNALLAHVEAGRTIIGLEPACLLAIRDDYRYLGLGEAGEKVAARAMLFEEFIAREIQARRFRAAFQRLQPGADHVLVHGHCHQKAVGAMKAMRRLLKAIPELKFELIESSCCGMAGSFGIEREHAALGMQMAELSLLPAVRAEPRARLVANGFSCRHQIHEGAGRHSQHIAILLRDALIIRPEPGITSGT